MRSQRVKTAKSKLKLLLNLIVTFPAFLLVVASLSAEKFFHKTTQFFFWIMTGEWDLSIVNKFDKNN